MAHVNPRRLSKYWILHLRWLLAFRVTHDILNELRLISKFQMVAKSTQVIVTVVVTTEEEGHLNEARFQANVTVDFCAERVLAFLLKGVEIGTDDLGHFIGDYSNATR